MTTLLKTPLKIDDWVWYGFELVQVIDVQPDHIKICRQLSDVYEEVDSSALKPFTGTLPDITQSINYENN